MKKILIGIIVLLAIGVVLWQVSERIPDPVNSIGEHGYESAELGITFRYADGFDVQKQQNALILLPKDYAAPQNGEGAPTITLAMYDNPQQLTLEQWVRTDTRSNFQLSANQVLEFGSFNGEPSIEYKHSGLYENDAIVVGHNGTIYVFSVSWKTPQDALRAHFQDLLSTIEFTR